MTPKKTTQLVKWGELRLASNDGHPTTLADLEDFCTEARRLGLQSNTKLAYTRQGFMGPVTGLSFPVPVEPKGTP